MQECKCLNKKGQYLQIFHLLCLIKQWQLQFISKYNVNIATRDIQYMIRTGIWTGTIKTWNQWVAQMRPHLGEFHYKGSPPLICSLQWLSSQLLSWLMTWGCLVVFSSTSTHVHTTCTTTHTPHSMTQTWFSFWGYLVIYFTLFPPLSHSSNSCPIWLQRFSVAKFHQESDLSWWIITPLIPIWWNWT